MIKKRGSGYGVRVYRGAGKWEWVGTFPREREAKRAERDALATVHKEEPATVGEFATVWLGDYEHRVKRSSYDRARHAVNALKKHDLKDEPVDGAALSVADSFASAHPSSIQTLVTIFNSAIARGATQVNPLRGKSRKGPGRKYLTPMTVAEVAELAELAAVAHPGDFGTVMRALVLFAGYSGMRPGEIYALEHRDIDRQGNRIMVRRRVLAGRLDLPKSNKWRPIVLFPEAAEALDLLPRRREGHVFRAKRGGRISQPLMSGCYWPSVRVAAAKPELDLYELRHFCGHHLYVTMDLPARVVATQLGHASPRLVEDLYGHFKVGALEEIDRALGRAGAPLKLVSDASETQQTGGSASQR